MKQIKETFKMRSDLINKKDLILEWIAEELPKREIAKRLGCKQETLNAYLAKMEITYTGQQAKKGQQKGPNKYKPAAYYLVKHGYMKRREQDGSV